MKIQINLNDNLPLTKTIELRNIIIVAISVIPIKLIIRVSVLFAVTGTFLN